MMSDDADRKDTEPAQSERVSEPTEAPDSEEAYRTRHGLDLDVRMIFAVLISFAVVLIGIVIPAVQVWAYNVQGEDFTQKNIIPPNTELVNHRRNQRIILYPEVKVDRQAGQATLPIDKAIPLFVQHERSKAEGEQASPPGE